MSDEQLRDEAFDARIVGAWPAKVLSAGFADRVLAARRTGARRRAAPPVAAAAVAVVAGGVALKQGGGVASTGSHRAVKRQTVALGRARSR